MPAPATAPFTARIEVRFTQDGQQIENVLHCLCASPPTYTELTTIAETIKNWWQAGHRSYITSKVSLASILVRGITHTDDPGVEYVTGLPSPGTGGADSLPNNVTVAVKLLTGHAGRNARGRLFHVGLEVATIADSHVLPGSLTALVASYQTLINNMNTAGHYLVVLSKFIDGAPRFEGVPYQILTAAMDPTTDSQRRRLPGRGR